MKTRSKRQSAAKFETADEFNNTDEDMDLKRIANFRFDQFDPKTEQWYYYKQRFELELNLNSLADQAIPSRNLLLKHMGAERYRLICDHFDPKPVTDLTYKEIVTFLDTFYRPTTNYLSERVKFGQTNRSDKQTITQFIGELRSKAVSCKFGKNLEERLRDQFLSGLNNATMLEKLFAQFPDVDATFFDIEKAAITLEAAQLERSALANVHKDDTDYSSEVHQVHKNTRKGKQPHKDNINKKLENGRDSQTPANTIDASKSCIFCNRDRHPKDVNCPAKESTCSHCHKIGHWRQCCLSTGKVKLINFTSRRDKQRNAKPNVNKAVTLAEKQNNVTIYKVGDGAVSKITVDVFLNGHAVQMEYDSAAHRSTLNTSIFQRLGSPTLRPTVSLDSYGRTPLRTLGEIKIEGRVGQITKYVTAIIIDDPTVSPLFGLDWMNVYNMLPNNEHITLSAIQPTIQPNYTADVNEVFDKFANLFNDRIGHVIGHTASFHVKPDARPVLARARPVPFALLQDCNDEIDRMVQDGVLEPVDAVDSPVKWASPIVITERKNGRIRVVGDFKSTLNPNIIFEPYPLPTFEEAVSKLSGSTLFSVLDLKDAFLQLEVKEECREFLTIVTNRGYYRYRRLPLGLTVSPLIFQKFIDTILCDIPGITWYQDDIAIGGRTVQEHRQRLYEVLTRLQQLGMRTQRGKVQLFKSQITFLGYKIDATGITPLKDKITALQDLSEPTNQSELRSFIGSINQYARFIPNLQQLLAPLHPLTSKYAKWEWGDEQRRLFLRLKNLLTEEKNVVHYQPDKPLVLTTDASGVGLGAVLHHRYDDGTLRLVAAASRTLSPAEKNYSNIDREALAIIFGVGKFDLYLRGREFVLQTDQKPLQRIFGENVGIPKMAASRLVRWAIALSAYRYKIEHIPGRENVVADMLSRSPLTQDTKSELELDNDDDHIEVRAVRDRTLDSFILTHRIVKTKSQSDETLAKVMGYVRRGWPEKRNLPSDKFHSYFEKRDEIYVDDCTLMWHDRVIIPDALRPQILHKLHETHLGASSMKSVARTTVWWPNLDKEIERYVSSCDTCRRHAPNEPETPLCLWNTPARPWERIHIDYTGPYEGKHWFVVVDARSRWLEIFPVNSPSTQNTIKCLRVLIARYGICNSIVCDNGTAFTSAEFGNFCKLNGIKTIFTTPYHSRSNGRVERAIRTFKWRYSKSVNDHYDDQDHRLQAMLFAYRTSVHSATGKTPCELFLGRNIRTTLDTLKPSSSEDTSAFKQKVYKDGDKPEKSFEVNESVYFKRKKDDKKWTPATITSRSGPLSYKATTQDDVNVRLHADHIQRPKRNTKPPQRLADYVR